MRTSQSGWSVFFAPADFLILVSFQDGDNVQNIATTALAVAPAPAPGQKTLLVIGSPSTRMAL